MQPESPMPPPRLEVQQRPLSPEQYPVSPTPETTRPSLERNENIDQEVSSADKAVSEMPLSLPAPPIQDTSIPVPAVAQTSTDDSPLVAADRDLIEEVWVSKAKQIVRETKDDPHQQETQVTKLQADYLKKRYGKEIKLASDQ